VAGGTPERSGTVSILPFLVDSGDDVVDETELLGFFGGHEIVPIGRLGDLLRVAPAVRSEELLELLFGF